MSKQTTLIHDTATIATAAETYQHAQSADCQNSAEYGAHETLSHPAHKEQMAPNLAAVAGRAAELQRTGLHGLWTSIGHVPEQPTVPGKDFPALRSLVSPCLIRGGLLNSMGCSRYVVPVYTGVLEPGARELRLAVARPSQFKRLRLNSGGSQSQVVRRTTASHVENMEDEGGRHSGSRLHPCKVLLILWRPLLGLLSRHPQPNGPKCRDRRDVYLHNRSRRYEFGIIFSGAATLTPEVAV